MKKFLKSCLALSMVAAVGCTSSTSESGIYTPGTYTGEADGFGGTVTVTVTVDANAITDVQVTGDSETPSVGGAALEELAAQIKEKGAEIDGVSGATFTSEGVKAAASAALAQAMGESTEGGEVAFTAGT